MNFNPENNQQPREPSEQIKEQTETLTEAVRELSQAAIRKDSDSLTAALNQIKQVSKNIDPEELLNSLRVPEDAGEYEEGLRKILARIPEGWGRWISLGRGWYPLIIELDSALAEIYPNYQIEQVKEKYAELRFYWSSNSDDRDNAVDRFEKEFRPYPENPKSPNYNEDCKEWNNDFSDWMKTQPEGIREFQAKQLVRQAEVRSSTVCELCGKPGEITGGVWLKTLCPEDAGDSPRQPRWIKIITPKEPWDLTTSEQAEELMKQIDKEDPEGMVQSINFSCNYLDWRPEKDNDPGFVIPDRKISQEFAERLAELVSERKCPLADIWNDDSRSTITIDRIDKAGQEILNAALISKGLRPSPA